MSVHILPMNDERAHEMTDTCWCDPRIEWLDPDTNLPWAGGGHKVVHNAADCREVVEQATREAYGGWKVVETD